MRLIDVLTLELEDFTLKEKPRYAILSHTWEDDEVTYQDIQNDHDVRKVYRTIIHAGSAKVRTGYKKIFQACLLAKEDQISYVWVDTCCIDKTSSAELSEAINSMYRWYKESQVCYAFLSDLEVSTDPDGMMRCRWWTRGWTLQELIAPKIVRFYDSGWMFRGTRSDHHKMIATFTKIDIGILQGVRHLESMSVAQRMSWASPRKTTRTEDEAYCLLGIFDVNIGLIYGEGRNAFQRLCEAIIAKNNDLSILACSSDKLIPESPAAYRGQHEIVRMSSQGEFAITNKGLKFTGCNSLWRWRDEHGRYVTAIRIGHMEGRIDPVGAELIYLGSSTFRPGGFLYISEPMCMSYTLSTFYVTYTQSAQEELRTYDLHLKLDPRFTVADVMPTTDWSWNTLSFNRDSIQLVENRDIVFALRIFIDHEITIGLFLDFRKMPHPFIEPLKARIYLFDESTLDLEEIFTYAGGRRREKSLSWYELERQHPQLYSLQSTAQALDLRNHSLSVRMGWDENLGRYDCLLHIESKATTRPVLPVQPASLAMKLLRRNSLPVRTSNLLDTENGYSSEASHVVSGSVYKSPSKELGTILEEMPGYQNLSKEARTILEEMRDRCS